MQNSRESITASDDNIDYYREKYTEGLTFVVGDTHGEAATLKALMEKVKFDPEKDHVYFVGDYNEGGNPHLLMQYISNYYQADYSHPGFHLIRGNHERELAPIYPLENLPDVIVLRKQHLNYFIAHAGMVAKAFNLMTQDMELDPCNEIFVYRLDESCAGYDAPLRQLVWSRRGLYSQRSRWRTWPSTSSLMQNRACILHGHTPYCYFIKNYFSYDDINLFWQNQHIWFSEDLQSFNLDSNIKGRYENGESYRGLACLCLEAVENVVEQNNGELTIGGLKTAPNGVFGVEYVNGNSESIDGDVYRVTTAKPKMKTNSSDEMGNLSVQDICLSI